MKAKSITKRVLSAMLCAVMLFSCWVFTAPTANAAAGTYDVKVYLDISNKMYCNGTQNITLYTNGNNGTGSQTNNGAQNFDTYNTGSVTKTWTGVGFPSKVTCYCGGSTWNNSGVKFGINVYVKKNGAADSAYSAVHTEGNATRSHTCGFFSTVGSFTETLTSFTNWPYANSWDDISGNASINVNTDGSTTNTASYTAGAVYDQYGVRWYQDASLQAVSSFPVNGVTYSNGKISVPASSNRASNYTVKIKETFSNWTAKEKEITINTFDYKVTFKDENGTTVLKSEQTVDYNKSATPPSDPTKASTATNHYTFNGWSGTYKNITSGAQSRDIKATYQATAHNSATYYKYTSVSATAHKKYCKDCDYVFAASEGHTANTAVEENRVEPTCTQAGSYDSVVYCKYCGYEMSRTPTAIPALGHKWEKQTINADTLYQAATCDNAARYYYSCSRCDAIEKNNNHYYTDGKPLGHQWGNWVDDNNPTAEDIDSGTHTRTCDRDGTHTQTENHTFGSWQQIPSNDTSGKHESHDRATYHFHECNPNGCGRIVYAEHNWVAKTPVPATCTEAGYTEYECSDCHQTTVNLNPGDSVPALGHDFQYDPTGTPTDTQHREACSRCDATRMVDHSNYGDWYEVDGTTHAHDCGVCGKAVTATHSNWSGWQHAAPTAEETGVRAIVREKLATASYNAAEQCYNYCTDCGYVKYQNHNWDDGVTTPAKCEVEGKTVYTCTDCQNTKEEKIDALGHHYVQDSVDPIDDGWDMDEGRHVDSYVYFYCDRCNASYCPATYDDTLRKYVKDTTNAKSTLAEIASECDPIPTPKFNAHTEKFNSDKYEYEYKERSSSFKLMKGEDKEYAGANTKQDFRFSGSVQLPVDISYKIGTDTDNVITDFGYVYSQDSYIGSDPNELILAEDIPEERLKTDSDEKYWSKIASLSVVGNKKTTNRVTQDAQNGGRLVGENGAWSGVSYFHKKDETTYELTFNLVISISAKNWKLQYAARPYVKYLYHGVEYTVYDGGRTGEMETYSHSAVFSNVVYGFVDNAASSAEKAYCMHKIIPYHNEFYPVDFEAEKTDENTDWWKKLDIWLVSGTTWEEFSNSDTYQAYAELIAPYSAQS